MGLFMSRYFIKKNKGDDNFNQYHKLLKASKNNMEKLEGDLFLLDIRHDELEQQFNHFESKMQRSLEEIDKRIQRISFRLTFMHAEVRQSLSSLNGAHSPAPSSLSNDNLS